MHEAQHLQPLPGAELPMEQRGVEEDQRVEGCVLVQPVVRLIKRGLELDEGLPFRLGADRDQFVQAGQLGGLLF